MTYEEINWDRTNIGENYPGITLPLTYIFIRDAYANVYVQFLKKIGLREKKIQQHQQIFANMLGYVEGHIFYNIENWYRFLKLLPAYKYNKSFFEAMLDPVVKKKVDGEHKNESSFIETSTVALRFIVLLIFFKRTLLKEFDEKFSMLHTEFESLDLNQLSPNDLVSHFNSIERQFFRIWANTIFNDFKVMIFYGILQKYSQKFGNESEKILRDVYSLKNQPRSMMPLQEIIQLALMIKKDKTFAELFKHQPEFILSHIAKIHNSNIKQLFYKYLKEYGERSSNELKLEEPKFKDKPELFIILLKNYIQFSENTLNELLITGSTKVPTYIPDSASWSDRIIIQFLKKITVDGIHLREYFRMKRGKAFGMAREMFLQIGKRLEENNDLKDKNDIFYLYKHEIFDYIQFHNLPTDFAAIISARKKQLESFTNIKMPRKITTRGLPNTQRKTVSIKSATSLRGKITSKGEATAEVIVMDRLDLTVHFKDKILVTTATDPGWTVIFPLLKGVITEQGGVLSHASIIAREIQIPCMVQVPDVTSILKTGQKIHLNAVEGIIQVIN